ncbi:MAG: hypothetical protein QOH64_3545, partial [Acidimicrobiaceae bacterium]
MSETLAPHAESPPTSGTSTPQALALRAVLVVAAVKSAVNLALSNRYGWHWDELYYRV